MIFSIYGFNPTVKDPYEAERENRTFVYLKEKIKVEISLNPYPTDEGYEKLIIEIAKSCCNQYQRIELVKLIEPSKEEDE